MPVMSWYIYIVRCADDTLYTGVTTNLDRRIKEHNSHQQKGARYTRARRPVSLVYTELAENRSEASVKEYSIKQLSRAQKESLCRSVSNQLILYSASEIQQ